MMPPSIMRVKIREADGKGFGFWIPFFLIWPLFLLLFLLLLPFFLVAEIAVRLAGTRVRPLAILWTVWEILGAMRGLSVDVQNPANGSLVRVYVA